MDKSRRVRVVIIGLFCATINSNIREYRTCRLDGNERNSKRRATGERGTPGGFRTRRRAGTGFSSRLSNVVFMRHWSMTKSTHEFAKIADNSAALLPFVQSYGRLGWYELLNDRGAERMTPWLRTATAAFHKTIRKEGAAALLPRNPSIGFVRTRAPSQWCLSAGDALKVPNHRERDRVCARLAVRLPKPAGFRERAEDRAIIREKLHGTLRPHLFVGGMLKNSCDQPQRCTPPLSFTGGALRSMWGGTISLIESIYTRVTDAITRGRLAQCADCGAVFIQTDERQRFCPPREGQVKSACMNRQRVRRYREKGRKGGQ